MVVFHFLSPSDIRCSQNKKLSLSRIFWISIFTKNNQALYGVLLKSTCAFFSSSMLFFGRNIQKVLFCAFFWAKMCFFLLSPIFFQENVTVLKVLNTKKWIFFKIFCTVLIFWEKIFGLASLGIKFTSICKYCPYISLDMMKIYRHNDWIW